VTEPSRLLVTGATGMIGGHVVRSAVQAGYRVRALVRRDADLADFRTLGVECVTADLCDPASLPSAVEGVDFIVHAAARVGDWGPVDEYRQVNVHGLRALLAAAQGAGSLRRWVQISSLGVYPPRHHWGTDESTPASRRRRRGYPQSKIEAEAVLKTCVDREGFPAVILRPGFTYGVGDRHILPRIIERLRSGKMRIVGDGLRVLHNTYAGNLADACLLAMEQDGVLGETFNIRDPRLVTRREFLGAIADHLGVPLPPRVSLWRARWMAWILETRARLAGSAQPPRVTQTGVRFLAQNLDFSIAKAQRRLAYQPRVDFRDGIRRALESVVGSQDTFFHQDTVISQETGDSRGP
jgi:nucleoside-diphosphate-sugar epimerase